MNIGLDRPDDHPAPLPDALASGLRALRVDTPPRSDLWPAIAVRLEPRGTATVASTAVPAAPRASRHAGRRLGSQRRNAGYAAAAAVVLAAGIGWQLWPAADAPVALRPVPGSTVATGAAADADAPLLRAADALAREYQGALREVGAGAANPLAGAAPVATASDLDAELERSATEVRAALARDPDALHLFHRLQRIYAHRLALSLRQA